VRRGERVTLTVTVTAASRRNAHGELPRLAHVDVIRGAVRGPAADGDPWADTWCYTNPVFVEVEE
jgi:hypothetical protein